MNTDSKNRKTRDETPTTDILRRKPTVEIDVDHYQSIIDDPGVSETRKRELIAIIGRIVVQFIDIGFDVHPVQLAQEKQASKADKNERHKHTNKVEKERQHERRTERIDA